MPASLLDLYEFMLAGQDELHTARKPPPTTTLKI